MQQNTNGELLLHAYSLLRWLLSHLHFYRAVLLSYRLTETYCIHKNAINIRNYMRDWKLTFCFLATNAISGQKSVCGQTQKYCKFYFEEAYDLKILKKK